MRVRYVSTAVLFVALASGLCASPPDVPVVIKAKSGQLVRVVVKADEGKLGSLRNFTDSEAFWGELVGPKGQRQFVFQAPADGTRKTYVVGWWTAGETDGVTTTIEIEDAQPPAPPDPVDPPEATAFAKAVSAAYKADKAADKQAQTRRLAAVYRAAAKTTVADATVKTYGDLFNDLESASRGIGVPAPPYLAGVRDVIGARLGKSLEAGATPIDRALAAKELAAVADALAAASK